MSTVDLVLTDSRLWARSESTHWDGAPSVVPASDGSSLIAGEPLQPPYPAVSAVRLADADRIAFAPVLPTVADAFAAIFGTALTYLRLPGPCERLTVVGPTEWGTRRRAALEAGARRSVGDIVVEPLALRVANLSASTSQQQRIAVVELNPLTTTVTLAGRSGNRTWIDSCEYEPTLGTADLAEGRGVGAVVDVIDRLLGGRKASYVVVVGAPEPALVDEIRAELTRRRTFGVDVRAMSGVELVQGGANQPVTGHALDAPQHRWTGSLHEHAATVQPPPQRRTARYLAAAALIAVIVAAVAVTVVLTRSGDHTTTAEPTAAPSSPTASPLLTETFGRVRAQLPAGWHVTDRSDSRVDISPDNGARERISLVQKPLSEGSGLEEVAGALEAQIAGHPGGTVGALQRDVVFGGRPGLSYQEVPGDGTVVRWQVLVDPGLQVSVGCQYPADSWDSMASDCEKFVADLRTGA